MHTNEEYLNCTQHFSETLPRGTGVQNANLTSKVMNLV